MTAAYDAVLFDLDGVLTTEGDFIRCPPWD